MQSRQKVFKIRAVLYEIRAADGKIQALKRELGSLVQPSEPDPSPDDWEDDEEADWRQFEAEEQEYERRWGATETALRRAEGERAELSRSLRDIAEGKSERASGERAGVSRHFLDLRLPC